MLESNDLKQILIQTQNLNILYVEDNEDARVQTLKMLGNYFDSIDEAVNGIDGLKKFNNNSYDIVFTDLNMPLMDGIEMIEQIRKTNLHIPIIVLSAYDDKEYFLETIKNGIDGYILKPYDFKQINEVISKVIIKLDIKDMKNNHVNLAFGYIWDKDNEHLIKNNEILKLTKNESKLIKLFIQNENQTITIEKIRIVVFNEELNNSTKIRNLLSRLKSKLGFSLIESNYALGYVLKKEQH